MTLRLARLEYRGYFNEEGVPFRENSSRLYVTRRMAPQAQRDKGGSRDMDAIPSCSGVRRNAPRSVRFSPMILTIICSILLISTGLAYFLLKTPPSEDPLRTESTSEYEEMSRRLKEMTAQVQKLKQDMSYLLPLANSLPNFALKSVGARIVLGKTSETYTQKYFDWLPIHKESVDPISIITGKAELIPGQCWPLKGDRGHVVIVLSHAAVVTHVSLGHISKTVSPTQMISSAPKEFKVYGMEKLEDEGIKLGTFLYDQDGDQYQTFKVADHQQALFKYIKLQVESNWGDPDYSCLYSFKVHGELPN